MRNRPLLIKAAVSFLLIVGVFSARVVWEYAPQAEAQQGGCTTIEEFEGNGNTTTPPFDIAGDRFVVNYAAVNTGPPEVPGVLGIVVRDANGNQVGNARLDGEGANSLSVTEGPGQFNIEVISAEVDYTLSVEDCGEAGGGDPPEEDPAPVDQYEEDPAPVDQYEEDPTPPVQDEDQYDNGVLMESGGPASGAMPKMPDGSCPGEFPVERGSGCHVE